jgi:hypothetical protein
MLKSNLLVAALAPMFMNADPEANSGAETTAPTPAPAAAKPAKAAKKAKSTVKKAAAKAEKKASKKKAKKAKGEVPKGPEALKQYAPDYVHDNENKTAGGNTSVHNGDDVAKKLVGKPLDEVYEIAAKVLVKADPDVTVGKLKKQYAHLNFGMQRMNLGNRMRGVIHAK